MKKTETPKDAQEERRDPCDCSTEEYLRRVKADYLLKMMQEKDSPASEEKKESRKTGMTEVIPVF